MAPPYQPRASFSRFSMACCRCLLRRADDRHGPHVAQESVERIEAFLQESFHVIHRVVQTGVRLNHPPRDHLHRSWLAHARFVVAIDIGAHRQLGFFLSRVQQLPDAMSIVNGVASAACRPRDRARFHAVPFHPHKHLGRCADELLIAELQQKFVWAGARALHALKQLRSFAGVRRTKRLVQHHLVIVAAPHALAHFLHARHVLRRRVIGFDRSRRNWFRRRYRLRCPWKRQRREPLVVEVVLVALLLFLRSMK